jgi:hypothetical protein
MAYNRTFNITQPFLGAPLQFNPALGSKELEELIDSYGTYILQSINLLIRLPVHRICAIVQCD